MKPLYAFIAGLTFAGVAGDVEVRHIKQQAYTLIRETIATFTPDEVESPCLNLTQAEKRAIGRYLETPDLGEVYPGIGRALADPAERGS